MSIQHYRNRVEDFRDNTATTDGVTYPTPNGDCLRVNLFHKGVADPDLQNYEISVADFEALYERES